MFWKIYLVTALEQSTYVFTSNKSIIMANKHVDITAEMLREAYISNLEAKRKSNAEIIADFTESLIITIMTAL